MFDSGFSTNLPSHVIHLSSYTRHVSILVLNPYKNQACIVLNKCLVSKQCGGNLKRTATEALTPLQAVKPVDARAIYSLLNLVSYCPREWIRASVESEMR